MKTCKVLIVDDSALVRVTIKNIIEHSPRFEVLDTAKNGRQAIEQIVRLKPDVVTLDITMPDMDGLQALKEIMSNHPVPVLMLSALTEEGTKATVEALQLGAVDFFPKLTLLQNLKNDKVVGHFLDKLEVASNSRVSSFNTQDLRPSQRTRLSSRLVSKQLRFMVIGCSTGGPATLREILPSFPKDFSIPILVCQHMPPGYTQQLSKSLNDICQMRVKEADDGEQVHPGSIYIAPSGFQTFVESTNGSVHFKIDKNTSEFLYKPCIDFTLMSLVKAYGPNLLSVIMTGMGKDGADGCRLVKERGGTVFTQAGNTCVVNGMPKAVRERGYSDMEFEPQNLYDYISRMRL